MESKKNASPSPRELDSEAFQLTNRADLDRLFSATYEELRRLAAAVMRHDAKGTITPTMLVHDAWIKLAASPPFATTSRLHFKRIAARAMRQVLVEAARRRDCDKRGGGLTIIMLDAEGVPTTCTRLLELDAALDTLGRLDPRQAAMVESKFFGGLDMAETAELLGVSESTVLREWRAVKAWLAAELS